MKRILVNATQPEELRLAIVDGQRLLDLDLESPGREQRKANVYKGRITRVEPSLEAAFVDYGVDRHGFLPMKEISREYFQKEPEDGKLQIRDLIKEGQEIIVQVEKEERGNKGAALTTFISLAGRYLVLMPNNPRAGGVSRRIEGEDRSELREALAELVLPEGMGVIARTAGVGRTAEELQWDVNYLIELWQAMMKASGERKGAFLIYQESNIIIRALRDYLRPDIGEIVVDNPEIHQQALEFMQSVMPHLQQKLKLYNDTVPLFSRFQIESQIETAHQREVRLPSGGALVIDNTEALTSIDINSARSTGGGNIEETAYNTNLEAAEEIARQLRLRDLGGLVVIDFIDMSSSKNQREVENRLRDSTKMDRARVQMGRISRFGLLEMSRQRLRPSLSEHSHLTCPRCEGHGTIRTVESLSLQILRLLEEESQKDRTARVIAQLPVSVAVFLLNEKRAHISEIEERSNCQLSLVANPNFETPQYEIKRVRGDQLKDEDNGAMSHQLLNQTTVTETSGEQKRTSGKAQEAPAVSAFLPSRPAPEPTPVEVQAAAPAKAPGLLQRLVQAFLALFRSSQAEPEPAAERKPVARSDSRRRSGSQKSNGRSTGNRRPNQNQTKKSSRRGDEIVTNRMSPEEKQAAPDRAPAGKSKDSTREQKTDEPRKQRGANPETPADDGKSSDEKPRSRRRGRRGGRRRRGSGEAGESENTQNQTTSADGKTSGAADEKGDANANAKTSPASATTETSTNDGSAPDRPRPKRSRRPRAADAQPDKDGNTRDNNTSTSAADRANPPAPAAAATATSNAKPTDKPAAKEAAEPQQRAPVTEQSANAPAKTAAAAPAASQTAPPASAGPASTSGESKPTASSVAPTPRPEPTARPIDTANLAQQASITKSATPSRAPSMKAADAVSATADRPAPPRTPTVDARPPQSDASPAGRDTGLQQVETRKDAVAQTPSRTETASSSETGGH